MVFKMQISAVTHCSPPTIANSKVWWEAFPITIESSRLTMNVICLEGFSLHGNGKIICDDGVWSALPSCSKEKISKYNSIGKHSLVLTHHRFF